MPATKTEPKPATKPRPRVKVVCRANPRSANGFSTDQPLRRSVPAADGLDGYLLSFAPGVPMAIAGNEIDACEKDLRNGSLVECSISDKHLLALLEDFADVERDRQIAELTKRVATLEAELAEAKRDNND